MLAPLAKHVLIDSSRGPRPRQRRLAWIGRRSARPQAPAGRGPDTTLRV